MSAADQSFVRYKSRFSVSWTLANARRLHESPCATSMGKPFEGRMVYVVGAGHSLTQNGEELRKAADLGYPIVTVNSADPVLRALGIRPDVLVVRESIDNSDLIAQSDARLVVADIATHPKVWGIAGDRLAWFIAGYPHTIGLAMRLGVAPLFGGSAALTSAVALSMHWGASAVVLVGCDLSFARDGERFLGYHPSAPRGDCTATIEGDSLHMHGNTEDDARCVASGQRPQPKVVGLVRTPPLDWSEPVPTLDTLLDQKRWLEIQAERHGERVEFLNATASGAGIVGWQHVTLEQAAAHHAYYPVLDAHGPLEWDMSARHATERQVTELVADLATEADKQRELSEEMLRPQGPRLRQLALNHSPLAESLAAWRIVEAPGGANPLTMCAHVYESMRLAAGEAAGILRGGS